MTTLQTAAAIVTALVTIVGAAWAIECHFAKERDFMELAQSFRQYQVEQSIDTTTNRLWDVQDRLKYDPKNVELQNQERELLERKRRLEMQQQQLDKGGT